MAGESERGPDVDWCVGCGVCGGEMSLNGFGKYVPSHRQFADAACPFGPKAIDATTIGRSWFPGIDEDPACGRYRGLFAGHVVEGDYREFGSSGGLATWLSCELLRVGEIDAVIHVRGTGKKRPLFAYAVSRTPGDVMLGAGSRYYPVEMSQMIDVMCKRPGRYAVVALPCFARALRMLANEHRVIGLRLACIVGLVCGGAKSEGFAQSLAWQCGVPPNDLVGINFRQKRPKGRADDFDIVVTNDSGDGWARRSMRELLGGDWGLGLFKLRACLACDDVFAETADVAVGDAWLRPYVKDPKGNNVLVVRSATIAELVEKAMADGRLRLDQISPKQLAKSQAASLRRRAEIMHWRDWYDWFPPTRTFEGVEMPSKTEQRNILAREIVRQKSHVFFREAKDVGDLDKYLVPMRQVIHEMAERNE